MKENIIYTVEYNWTLRTQCTFRAYKWQFVSTNLSGIMYVINILERPDKTINYIANT